MAENNQLLIQKIETKISETQTLIANYEGNLTIHKNMLSQLTNQLSAIKNTICKSIIKITP